MVKKLTMFLENFSALSECSEMKKIENCFNSKTELICYEQIWSLGNWTANSLVQTAAFGRTTRCLLAGRVVLPRGKYNFDDSLFLLSPVSVSTEMCFFSFCKVFKNQF